MFWGCVCLYEHHVKIASVLHYWLEPTNRPYCTWRQSTAPRGRSRSSANMVNQSSSLFLGIHKSCNINKEQERGEVRNYCVVQRWISLVGTFVACLSTSCCGTPAPNLKDAWKPTTCLLVVACGDISHTGYTAGRYRCVTLVSYTTMSGKNRFWLRNSFFYYNIREKSWHSCTL